MNPATEACLGVLCFVPPSSEPYWKLFGFAEFLTALALLVVVYTTADVRYKFRTAIAPGNLHHVTFYLTTVIGFGILLTDVWAAQAWWVPRAEVLSRGMWQAIFGGLFLGTFLTWMFYAFIRPPSFGRRNAERYAQVLFSYVLRGNDDELRIIASELARSAHALITMSRALPNRFKAPGQEEPAPTGGPEDYAHDVLLLIADRRLCRHIVESAPHTVQVFFEAMADQHRFNIPVIQFTRNVSSEALSRKTSFVYGEAEGFESGLMGYLKPVSVALYGNHRLSEGLAERVGSPLDVHYQDIHRWDPEQWEGYSRVVLLTVSDYLKKGHFRQHSYALTRAFSTLQSALFGVAELNDSDSPYNEPALKRLEVILEFVKQAAELVDKLPERPPPLRRQQAHSFPKDFYDELADLLYKACLAASRVTSPKFESWHVQHNTVWEGCFGSPSSAAWTIIRRKLRRRIYDEIVTLESIPNYENAPLLGFCLNVAGFRAPARHGTDRDSAPLILVVRSWTIKNYGLLWAESKEIASEVLVGSLSFDEAKSRLVKTYIRGLSKEAPKHYLPVAPSETPRTFPTGRARRLKPKGRR